MDTELTYSAFTGSKLLVSGDLRTMLLKVKARVDRDPNELVLIFEDQTGKQIDYNFQGTREEVLERAIPQAPKVGPGRPKLGVISREISLLPRHWEWLEHQPQGISAAVRRLIEDARKKNPGREKARQAMEAVGRFMTAMAGDRPNYEEATRALYASDHAKLVALIRSWPKDVRNHIDRVLHA